MTHPVSPLYIYVDVQKSEKYNFAPPHLFFFDFTTEVLQQRCARRKVECRLTFHEPTCTAQQKVPQDRTAPNGFHSTGHTCTL